MADLIEEVDGQEAPKESEPKPGFLTKKKIIIIVLVLALLGSAFPAMKIMKPATGKKTKPEFYRIEDQIMVGVRDTLFTRTLICQITLKVDDNAVIPEIEEKKDELMQLFINILQMYPLDELDYRGQNKLRRQIEEELNLNLKTGKVLTVLFREFLIR